MFSDPRLPFRNTFNFFGGGLRAPIISLSSDERTGLSTSLGPLFLFQLDVFPPPLTKVECTRIIHYLSPKICLGLSDTELKRQAILSNWEVNVNHETRMELTRHLEKIKQANEGANARWLFIAGTSAEILGGVGFLVGAIKLIIDAAKHDEFYWFGFLLILCAVILLGHAVRVISNRFMNRTLRPLIEAVLQNPEP
jgi:hypothetical protein